MNKVDYLEKNLERQLSWIQRSDTRISLLLPLTTTMGAVLAALVPAPDKWTISSIAPSIFTIVLLALCVIFTACATFPRTNGPSGSGIFFGGIAKRTASQYSEYVNKLDDHCYTNDLAGQCYINAQIAHRKINWVKRAMICLFLSFLPWVISIYFLYQVKYGTC